MKLPALSGKDVSQALERAGFRLTGMRGSHAKYRLNELTAIVPMHKDLCRGTIGSILRQAGLSNDQMHHLIHQLHGAFKITQ